ncbi:MAG: PilZ domain-containing protein [Ghiorsea sp.]
MQNKSINQEKPLQFDAIYQILLKGLGSFEENRQFASQICRESIDDSLHIAIHALLEKKVHIHKLLTALSACEKNRLQYAFDSTSTLPAETQLASAKLIINHFNTIQDTLIDTASKYFQDHLERREQSIVSIHDTGNRSVQQQIKSEAHIQALSESIHDWTKSKSIMVHNYYHGLAIRARIGFLAAGDGKLRLQLNEELARIFAAHPNQDTAFAICKNEEMQVRLRIDEAHDGTVLLDIDDVIPAFSESRKHLNVQVLDHVPATVRIKGHRRSVQAEVHDLSMGGLGVTVQGMGKSPCNIADEIECNVVLNQKPLSINGVVRWIGVSDDEARIGIEIGEKSNAKQFIQKEIFRIQRNIIVAMNQLESPKSLANAVLKSASI